MKKIAIDLSLLTLSDGGRYHIETSLYGFYMITLRHERVNLFRLVEEC